MDGDGAGAAAGSRLLAGPSSTAADAVAIARGCGIGAGTPVTILFNATAAYVSFTCKVFCAESAANCPETALKPKARTPYSMRAPRATSNVGSA
jgi:hypothetical protein